jgi:hypothetical protein
VIDGKRVVLWTPFGRERTVSILEQYARREHERGIVDEWWLCENTDEDQASDLAYGIKLAVKNKTWIKRKRRPDEVPMLTPKQRNTGYFYREMTDPDTVYVRCDDDIIYLHEQAVERLVRHRLQVGVGVASFPVMWNNSVVSWFLQQAGVIPREWGAVGGPYCMDPVGWANGQFAVKMHDRLLTFVQNGDVESLFLYQDYQLPVGLQFSVSFFSSLGEMYAKLPTPGVLEPSEEEHWHTVHRPQQLGQANVIVGNALVSHYSFFPQRGILDATDILERYRSMAKDLT